MVIRNVHWRNCRLIDYKTEQKDIAIDISQWNVNGMWGRVELRIYANESSLRDTVMEITQVLKHLRKVGNQPAGSPGVTTF